MMYTDEMDQWLAEARREETHSEARLRAALLQEQQQQQQQQQQHQVRFLSLAPLPYGHIFLVIQR